MFFFFEFYSMLKIDKPGKGSNMIYLDTMSTLNHFKMGV